ncbi:MAG: alpha/beta fold hydrolase [Gammaproteobacteria bacterium]|nr:alpha/beta fold hydrolase [Gammaproteobacteria bacterium]MBU0788349.1 alpha/beta fold hydrolase [Gammaproteobacteria bacterium]MBU0815154.1 alpha/beta fold hydrolase [Gammaproteobacteria bacterium]MBU1785738.1 alpha/beta fold hydrolase [Gammaproteobacteria bacterium]
MQIQTLSSGSAQLALRVYEPASPAHASVVIGGAMGVRQDFYASFAEWLAGQGYRVSTFDYRGSGDSRPDTQDGSLRGYRADLLDWTSDYAAVIDAAKAALPQAPLYLLGHSLGAQLPGLLKNPGQVDGMLSIAAGSGYWRDNAPQLKRVVLYFWYVLVPLATRLFGYFPGRKLRKVGDLPTGVIMQWRKWCLDPHYSVGAEGESARQSYARVSFPVRALAISDDELMTLRGTQNLVSFYTGASCSIEHLTPGEAGVKRIGHFGFFREQFNQTLWPHAVQILERMREAAATRAAGVTRTTA